MLKWTEQTVAWVSTDHRARSPLCGATHLKDLVIPVAGADRIGGAPVQ